MDKFKSDVPVISSEFKDLSGKISKMVPDDYPKQWSKWAESFKVTDKAAIQFFSDVDSGKKNIKDIGTYIESASKSSSTFNTTLKAVSATLKTVAANMVFMLVINAAVQGLAKAWDSLNVTVEEQKDKVDSLKTAYEGLRSEYDTLREKAGLSTYEKERLNYLERRLELDKQILDIEQKQLYKEQIGTGNWTDGFDKDSLKHKRTNEQDDRRSADNLAGISTRSKLQMESYSKLSSKLESLVAEQSKLEEGSARYEAISRSIMSIREKEEKSLIKLQKEQDNLVIKQGEYLANAQIAQVALDSGLLTGEDLAYAQEMANYWNQMYQDAVGVQYAIQKATNTYNPGETNGLVRRVSNKFGSVSDSDVGTLSDEDLEYALQIKVDPKSITSIDELKAKIEELKAGLEEANKTPLSSSSISQTIDQLNTQLKPTFDSLKSAYQNIFTTEDGKEVFTLKNVDISMLKNIQSSIEELSEIDGIDIDTSSFEDFAKVLVDSSSTANDVQGAFNDLANVIVGSLNPGLSELNSENYLLVQSMLESLGVVNAEEVMIANLGYSYVEYIAAKNEATQAGLDLATATDEEVSNFVKEQLAADNCGQALATLQLKKLLVNSTQINATTDVQQILALANAANITSSSLVSLANAKVQFDSASASGDKRGMSLAARGIQEAGQKTREDILNFKAPEINFDGNINSAGKSGKAAGDAYVDAFEKSLGRLNSLREQGKITEAEYLQEYRKLYERYFKDIDKYAKEFADNQAKYLDGMASMYESVFSYISSAIGKKISGLNNERDSAIESLKNQQEAAQAAYQAEIDGIDKAIEKLEAEKDAIQKAADERQRNIDLQKAQYDLQRMQEQRTSRVYTEDGFVYQANTTGIRDAHEEVAKAKEELKLADLDNQIDKLNDHKKSIEDIIDASNKYFEAQIESTQKYFDALISSLEKEQSKWDELLDLKKQAEMMALLEQLGFTEEQILSGSGEAYEAFKQQYLSVLKDMYSGNDTILAQYDKLTGMDVSGMTGYIEATASAFNGLSDSAQGIENIATKLDDIKESAEGAASAIASTDSKGGSLANAIQDLPGVGHEEFDTSIQEIISTLDEFIANLEDRWNHVQEITAIALIGGSSGGEKESATPSTESSGKKDEGSSGGIVGTLQQAVEDMNNLLNGEEESLKSAFKTLLEEDPTLLNTWTTISTIFADSCISIIESLTSVMSKIDEFIAKCGELESSDNSLMSGFKFGFTGKAYASGTKNAKQGINLVGEDGLEVVKDNNGNIGIATSPTLVKMEGGETVYNADESRSILNDNLIPYDGHPAFAHIGKNYEHLLASISTANPISNIAKGNLDAISRNINSIQNNQRTQSISQVFNVSLPNVTNSTSAEFLMKDLQLLSTKKMQFFN